MVRVLLTSIVLGLVLAALPSPEAPAVSASASGGVAGGFIDDQDDDNDGVADIAEQNCGGNATNPNVRPERIDDNFAGRDDDGDTQVDEALPGGSGGFDCDGDGYIGTAEDHVFSAAARGNQDACGTTRWPADLTSGGTFSLNKINISDLATFITPVRYINTNVGTNPGDVRWDVVPGSTFGTDINVQDIASITVLYPPMFASNRAFGYRACPWPITSGGYELSAAIPDATYNQMTELAMIPGSNDEAVVALQGDQQIWRISLSGAFTPTLYGDLNAYVGGGGGEEGLLSVAFSPDFANDHRIYAYYTRGGGSSLPTILARFQVVGNVMDTSVETVVIQIPDFANNHNGGRIAFGNDGYLYLSLGDGGGGGDPNENGQNPNTLLGKVLRLNVTGQATYSIPPTNPYVGVAGADEIFALGFRNPWRMSIDSFTGDAWLGDVGQGTWEEVDRVVNGGNYGWDCFEGNDPFESAGCDPPPPGGFRPPRAVYPNPGGGGGAPSAVTGGFVSRGPLLPELNGYYIYADFYDGRIWAANTLDSSAPIMLVDTPYLISSFAELPNGDLLVLTFNNAIYRLRRL
jgi:glucose/arabinose dehydrogenase